MTASCDENFVYTHYRSARACRSTNMGDQPAFPTAMQSRLVTFRLRRTVLHNLNDPFNSLPRRGPMSIDRSNEPSQPTSASTQATTNVINQPTTEPIDLNFNPARRSSIKRFSLRQKRKKQEPAPLSQPADALTPRPRASILGFWQRRRCSTQLHRERSPMLIKKQLQQDSLEESSTPTRDRLTSSPMDVTNSPVKQRNMLSQFFRPRSNSVSHRMESNAVPTSSISRTPSGLDQVCEAQPHSLDETEDYIIPPTGMAYSRWSSTNSVSVTAVTTRPVSQDSGLVSHSSSCSLTGSTISEEVMGMDEKLSLPYVDTHRQAAIEPDRGTLWRRTDALSRHLRQSLDRATRRCRLLVGQTLFNQNPVEGLAYLTENGIVPLVPSAIAGFLLRQTGLSRQAIGDYFGALNNPMAREVLKKFLELLELKDLEVDEALRVMLSHFHPSGESQKISHIMQAFQSAYRAQNIAHVEHLYHDEDTVEVLAYSTLMLQTDLHNPNLRRLGAHMTAPEFVENNRGIDAGEDVPDHVLHGIYQRIASSPFRALTDPVDRLRQLDSVLIGPLKTSNLIQRHRRYVGWVMGQELDRIPTRGGLRLMMTQRSWRRVLVFNDILLIVKPVNHGPSGRRTMTSIPSTNGSATSLLASSSTESGTREYYSTEPFTSGTYQVRTVVPLKDVAILVFETQYARFGVRLCNADGPVLNLSLPSAEARKRLIDWIHLSVAELRELQAYFQRGETAVDRDQRRATTGTTIAEVS